MVWFQCEDCGENLKKPKLPVHFARCSARKVSCIDCGVVFDQDSVRVHTTCISEVEKYGPKGKPGDVTKSKKVQNGPEVDLSRGLSVRPPWACSLCNIKASSKDALDAHAQGKQHRNKSKAAAAKDGSLTVETNHIEKNMGSVVTAADNGVDLSDSGAERKRKIENGKVSDDVSLGQKPKKKEKNVREDGDVRETEPTLDLEKKRKHAEVQDIATGSDSDADKKKTRRKGKSLTKEENGQVTKHDEDVKSDVVNEIKSKGKKKKSREGEDLYGCPSETPIQGLLACNASPQIADTTNGLLLNGTKCTTSRPHGSKGETNSEVVDCREEETSKVEKKKHRKLGKRSERSAYKSKVAKEKESIVHEVSFREWLGDDDLGGSGGTPTHPPMDKRRDEPSTELEKAKSQRSQVISKVVKWKKLIREALGKSPEGRMKKKDLSKAVLSVALKAVKTSAAPVLDRKVLKEEFLRQITCSSKFALDGKHVMLVAR